MALKGRDTSFQWQKHRDLARNCEAWHKCECLRRMSLQSTMRPGSIKFQEDPSPTFANQTLQLLFTLDQHILCSASNGQCDMQEAMRNWWWLIRHGDISWLLLRCWRECRKTLIPSPRRCWTLSCFGFLILLLLFFFYNYSFCMFLLMFFPSLYLFKNSIFIKLYRHYFFISFSWDNGFRTFTCLLFAVPMRRSAAGAPQRGPWSWEPCNGGTCSSLSMSVGICQPQSLDSPDSLATHKRSKTPESMMDLHVEIPIVIDSFSFSGRTMVNREHIFLYYTYIYICIYIYMYIYIYQIPGRTAELQRLMSQWIPKARVDKAARPGGSRIQWVQLVQSCPAFWPLPSYMNWHCLGFDYLIRFDSERKAHD